ncbi:MAG: ATP synthase F1 subunit epsilon [Hyphomicrobiales bacterium]|nr:ATP synthase F1 subunit epsilon [Hyphomicrobiales bacterium]
MADALTLDIVTPDALLASRHVTMAVIPGTEGEFGVMAHHAPLIATLRPGVLTLFEGDKPSGKLFTAGGFVEVAEGRCTVLATEALDLESVTTAQAEERVYAAEKELKHTEDDATRAGAEKELAVATALLAAVK